MVDLPQPDSPTRPSVSPGRIARSTRSTARTPRPVPSPACRGGRRRPWSGRAPPPAPSPASARSRHGLKRRRREAERLQAGGGMTVRDHAQRRRPGLAYRPRRRAARREAAAARQSRGAGHRALDRGESRRAVRSSSGWRRPARGCRDGPARRRRFAPARSRRRGRRRAPAPGRRSRRSTPRSWVINRIDRARSRRRSRRRSRICAWIVTSSAVVGSSAISSFAPAASAMAIITRWRMPPDISCG